MSRYFMVQSWVGSHENEPDYNGNQCGERNVRSSEVVPLYDQYGNANIKAFSDEALQKKSQAKPKLSAFDKVCTTDRTYEKLCSLSEELDQQLESGELSFSDWSYARKQLDKKLDRAWANICKLRGWDDNGQEQMEKYPTNELTFDCQEWHDVPKPVDYSIIPESSAFKGLSDNNVFKIIYTQMLTACKWFAKFTSTAKQLVQEGLV